MNQDQRADISKMEKRCDEVSDKLKEFGYDSCFFCGIDPKELKRFIRQAIAESNAAILDAIAEREENCCDCPPTMWYIEKLKSEQKGKA